MEHYLYVLKNYAVFSGRAKRSEYWFFVLFNVLITAGISLIAKVTGLGIISMISGLYGLAVFIPSLAVTVRRLHDTNRSGFWIFIGVIPFIGFLVLLYFLVSDSQPGSNQYGS